MNDRIEHIREQERMYHESCYEQNNLFEAGSWLHKPVKTVMDHMALFSEKEYVAVLDLGCGVGRNSIPIAEAMRCPKGKVVCVDILESALSKSIEYSEQYHVREYVETVPCDIGEYAIAKDEYDYIIAVSSLEHVRTIAVLSAVLDRMTEGTKLQGVNCIIFNTNIQETDAITGECLEPFIEINMDTNSAIQLFTKAYVGWEVLVQHVKPLEFKIDREGREIVLSSQCLTFVVKKV